jgi:hypothetical protein
MVGVTDTLQRSLRSLGIGGRLGWVGTYDGKTMLPVTQEALQKECLLMGTRHCARHELAEAVESPHVLYAAWGDLPVREGQCHGACGCGVLVHLWVLPFAWASLAISPLFLVCLTARAFLAHGFTASSQVTGDAAGNGRVALRIYARAEVMDSKAASHGLNSPSAYLRFCCCPLTRPQGHKHAPSPGQPWC